VAEEAEGGEEADDEGQHGGQGDAEQEGAQAGVLHGEGAGHGPAGGTQGREDDGLVEALAAGGAEAACGRDGVAEGAAPLNQGPGREPPGGASSLRGRAGIRAGPPD